jgi:hypothetical protein
MLNWRGVGGEAKSMICETDDDGTAVAGYISELMAELVLMAARADQTELVRVLEMARLEAERLCGRGQDEAPERAADGTAQDATGQFKSTNVVLLTAARGVQK